MTIRMTQRASQKNQGLTGLLGNASTNNNINMLKKQQQSGPIET